MLEHIEEAIRRGKIRALMLEFDRREVCMRRCMAGTPPYNRLYVKIAVGMVEDGQLRVDRDLVL